MREDEFKKGIEKIKNIKLSSSEKSEILARVLSAPVLSPYAPKPSVWSILLHQSRAAYVFAVLFLLVFVGSTLAYNAENSLPGDKLYSLKVGVTEPIRDIANISPEQKAEWESVKTVRRLDEAINLAAEGKLDEKSRVDLEKRFNKHTDAFDASLNTISTSTEKTDLIEIEFEAGVSSKTRVFEDWEKKLTEREKIEKSQNTVKTDNKKNEEKREETELRKFKNTVFEKIEKRKNSREKSVQNGIIERGENRDD